MNCYVLFARHLGKVSGEKIYTYNKMEYLLSQGWQVIFLSCKEETTPVDRYDNYHFYAFPALTYAPECYSRSEIKRTVDAILKVIINLGGENCIIESDSINRAAWAELIARQIKSKHLVFLLQEIHHYDEETRNFLRFKYDRHELAGITVDSINQMLGDDSIERREDTKIAAMCNNVVKDCADDFSCQLKEDVKYSFGSIGRLDKGCVSQILKGFRDFSDKNPKEKFNLVLLGGATGEKRIHQIRKEMKDYKNINLIITGYIYPIPETLIRNIDLFVSTAGSSVVTYRYHRPTVRVHPVSGEPVGILGLDDIEGKTMYDIMPNTTIVDCIEKALKNKEKIIYIYNYYEDYNQKMRHEFERQLSFANIIKEKDYYDEKLLMHIRSAHIKGHIWHKIAGHLFGAYGLNSIISLYKKIKRF